MRRRTTDEGGFGVIELLIAMTVMAVGIMAIVAGFSSGIIALDRASRTGTAGTLADKQMEAYRALGYSQIALSGSLVSAAATPYATDSALTGNAQTGNFDLTDSLSGWPPAAYNGTYCNTTPVTCTPVQASVTGPDGRTYRVDTYIVWYCAVGTLRTSTFNGATFTQTDPGCTDASTPPVKQSRPVKKITVVVRDGTTTTKTYVRETSTFDQAT